MTGFMSTKMKRKDLEEVYDDFSDFSLSSPARKIRRLDAELPPILEEEESGIPRDSDQPVLHEEQPSPALVTEVDPSNDERALILYKPVNTPLLQSSSSSNFSITVNSDLIPCFKKQVYWSSHPNMLKTAEDITTGANDCLAVIPWVHGTTDLSEPMEAEEVDYEKMEVEEDNSMHISEGLGEGQGREGEGLQQWQCMTPQLPQNTSTPVMWSS